MQREILEDMDVICIAEGARGLHPELESFFSRAMIVHGDIYVG